MNSRIGGTCCLGLLLLLASCDSDAPTGIGKLVTFDTVCDKANEGQRVSLEGFLDFPDRFNAKASTIVMRLQSAPTRTSKAIGARVKLNAGTNTVLSPPDKYNEKDLKAVTHDGKPVSYRTRLKVTGEMSYVDSLTTKEFTCFLTEARLEIAGAVATK